MGKGLGIGLCVWQMSGGKRGDVALLELFLAQTDKAKPLGPQAAQKFLFRLSRRGHEDGLDLQGSKVELGAVGLFLLPVAFSNVFDGLL